MDMDSELLAERLVDQTELLFRNGPQKQIGKHAQGECFVLRCLARSEKPLLPSDLSSLAQSSTARIAVVLNTLEKKGYITRAIDPSDRRRVLVSPGRPAAAAAADVCAAGGAGGGGCGGVSAHHRADPVHHPAYGAKTLSLSSRLAVGGGSCLFSAGRPLEERKREPISFRMEATPCSTTQSRHQPPACGTRESQTASHPL